MVFHSIVLYLSRTSIIADTYKERAFIKSCQINYNPETDPYEAARTLASQILAEEAPQMIACPGGLLKPLHEGAYIIDDQVCGDAQREVFGHHDYNYLLRVCAELGKKFTCPAVMIDPVSSDGLLPANRITSMPEVEKRSRYHACEQNDLLREACLRHNKCPEDIKAIAVWMDDIVSVGSHRNGTCVEVNDAFGGEGPMGFRSSGDVPVASLARVYFDQGISADELWRKMCTESGIYGYTGTDDPQELDRAIDDGNETAEIAVKAAAYQTAKWIGMCAFALQGDVDFIAVGGKGVSCRYLKQELKKRVEAIAPVYFIETSNLSIYLAEKACLVYEKAAPLLKY